MLHLHILKIIVLVAFRVLQYVFYEELLLLILQLDPKCFENCRDRIAKVNGFPTGGVFLFVIDGFLTS